MNCLSCASKLKSAKKTRGVASVAPRYGDVLGHNRAGADDDMITNGNRKDSSICSNTHKVAKVGLTPKAPFLCRAAGEEAIIDEHRPMRNEAIVPDRDELTDK